MDITCPNCSPNVRKNPSSLKIWHRSTTCTHTGQSKLAIACGAFKSKCGRQLAKKIAAVSHFKFVCLSACRRHSSFAKVTSNKLFAFNESRVREGCNDSLAQGVRVFSHGCLPCILPSKETAAFAAQLALRVFKRSAGIATLSFRGVSFPLLGWSCSSAVVWPVCCSWSLCGECSIMVVWASDGLEVYLRLSGATLLLALEANALLPARVVCHKSYSGHQEPCLAHLQVVSTPVVRAPVSPPSGSAGWVRFLLHLCVFDRHCNRV